MEDWKENKNLVMAELKRLDEGLEKIDNHISELQQKIAALEVKSGTWGAIAGISVVVISVLIKYVVSK